jgi:protein involved in polysaccharide export with SLBB domain
VGAVPVAGVRADQLEPLLRDRIGALYRNFGLSVVVGRLRGVRVYVTGFAARPGAYTLGSLSTLVNAVIAAGGPSQAGTFRDVELRRGAQVVTHLDLYDLLIAGDKRADAVLQSEDVIRIGPVGPQVAIFGSVNAPAIYEAKPGETVVDLVRFAGGLSSVADETRFAVERLANRSASVVEELPFSSAASTPLSRGDVFRLFSVTDVALPLDRQAKLVRIDGEVVRPGDYYMPPGSTLSQLIERAGGLTPRAFVFGAEFTRESVRVQQQLGYDRAVDEFERGVTNATLTTRVTAEEAPAYGQRMEAMTRLLASLRKLHPKGRVVLATAPEAKTLPEMPLENGDRLYMPPLPTTIQVFGSVFNPGSFAYAPHSKLDRYVRSAGGPRRGADTGSMFVIRADGSVRSNQQGWRADIEGEAALPGDTVFVPEEMNKTTWLQGAKDISQIVFQFGLGAAGLKVLFGL